LKLLNHKALKALNEILDPDPDTVRLLTVVACVFIICHFTGSLFWLVKSLSNDPDQVNEFLLSKKFEKLWFCGKKLPEGFEPCEQSATWYVVGMWLVCLAAMRRLVGSTHTNRWVGI
jgi:phage shock protein PspC (stress-responsive transcriptional regulator)